jgi:hypothetical protein
MEFTTVSKGFCSRGVLTAGGRRIHFFLQAGVSGIPPFKKSYKFVR